MASEAQPKASTSSKKRSSASLNPATETSGKSASFGDLIWTPEKPERLPHRGRRRSIAFSVKEVRRVALGLQTGADRPDLAQSGADLSSAEVQLGAGSGSSSFSKSSKAETLVKLPQKYEMLCEFFNCMESSIRLLRLKGLMSTFPNICTSIQHLSERRFTYAHLAQLKFIMPEAVVVKKVLALNETTCCMKPELQVMLQVDAVAKSIKGKGESGYSILRSVFRERIVNFLKDHPEEDDVPEDQLPHPFSQTKPSICPNLSIKANTTCSEPSLSSAGQQQVLVPSHMSQSFQRRFSRKFHIPISEKTHFSCVGEASPINDLSIPSVSSPLKCTSEQHIYNKSMLGSPISTTIFRTSGCDEVDSKELPKADNNCINYFHNQPNVQDGTPAKVISTPLRLTVSSPEKFSPDEEDSEELRKADNNCSNYFHKQPNVEDATPAKVVSTPLRLMVSTPEIFSPERCRTTSNCDSPILTKSVRRSTRTKLFMTPRKTAKTGDECCEVKYLSSHDDVLNILPESFLQSIKEKEKKAAEAKEAGVANAIKRQKMIASLPNVFNMILLTFQSCNRSVMTKQELIQKLTSNNLKIVDRGEVEEQLNLLIELVPDWISEKVACSGDILCCVNKLSNPEEIRQRLSEAD